MNLIKLEIVVLIAKYQKVTTVAEVMKVKQPTVSFHMKSLEEEYGVRLFESRAGKVLLTEAGQALLHYARKIQTWVQEGSRAVDEYRDLAKGSLNIGASYVPGTYMLPQMIQHFAARYPGVTIRVKIRPAAAVRDMLHAHDIDLALISAEPFQDDKLHINPLQEDDLVFIVPPDHPYSTHTHFTADMAAKERFILHDLTSSTRQITEQWASRQGIAFDSRCEMDSLEAIKQAVRQGLGISMISRLAVEEEIHYEQLCAIPPEQLEEQRYVYTCYRRDRWLSAQMRAFLESVQTVRIPYRQEMNSVI